MNETHYFWPKVRRAINDYPGGWCKKWSDAALQGMPDCIYVVDGATGFLELKFAPKRPTRADTIPVALSPIQRDTLNAIRARRGTAHVLLGIGRHDCYLLTPEDVVPHPTDPDRPGSVELWRIPESGSVGGIWHGSVDDLPLVLARRP